MGAAQDRPVGSAADAPRQRLDVAGDHILQRVVAGAARIAERIRERIATYAPADRRLARLRLTASIGLAMSFAESSATDVLERADQALYTAKHHGKNRVSTMEQI